MQPNQNRHGNRRILLLEDDISAAVEIELIFENLGNCEVHCASNLSEANRILKDQMPDAIIADLHLENDELSLDWLQVHAANIPTIILSSNYSDNYFARALNINVNAYLIKPVNAITLKFEVEKILASQKQLTPNQKVVIKDGAKYHVLDSQDIIWLEAEGNYSTIQTHRKKIVVRTSLNKLFKELDKNHFVRIHRSTIVSLNQINLLHSSEDRLVLVNGHSLPVGKTYKTQLKKLLANLGMLN